MNQSWRTQARLFSECERLEEALLSASSAARLLLQCLLSRLEPVQMERAAASGLLAVCAAAAEPLPPAEV